MELKRRKKPEIVLKRRKKLVLKKRKRPNVYYCNNKSIKNRLPYPIECSWAASLQEACNGCKKQIIYWYWKSGGYNELRQKLEARKYYPSEADIKKEEETSRIAAGKEV